MHSTAFEQLVMALIRSRPDRDDWQQHLCHAVLGWFGEASNVLRWCESWEGAGCTPSREDAVAALWAFETYRAWSYYQLDQRPHLVRLSAATYASSREAAADLASGAGQLANLVRAWVFNGGWLDGRLEQLLSRIEAARVAIYQRLALDESLVQMEALQRVPAQAAVGAPSWFPDVPGSSWMDADLSSGLTH
jgi:hypothetical protein